MSKAGYNKSGQRIKEMQGLETMVSSGVGDFIVKEAVDPLDTSSVALSSVYGKEISATFPAYAVAKLLEAYSST